MFPEKIKITDDMIKLIIDTRKAHDLTAYQLSEKIGKNKSWLPNIENKRTKNISRSDLYLLFKDFADEENLRPEQYIVSHLPRNTIIELEGGVTAPCYHVRQMLDVEYWEDLDNLPQEQLDREMDFDYNGITDELKAKDISASVYRLSATLNEFLSKYSLDQQESYSFLIDNMTINFEHDFERTLNIYGNHFFPRDPMQQDTNVKKEYIADLDVLQKSIDIAVRMIGEKAFVYSFIEETPFDTYQFFEKMRNWDSLTDPEDEKLYFALEDIKNYHFGVYAYIDDCISYSTIFKKAPKIEYYLIFSKLHEMFTLYVKAAKINYTFDFSIPDDSITYTEIEKLHRQTDKIIFEIEKEVRSRFKNRNSWCFS